MPRSVHVPDPWRTLSQWEPVRGLLGTTPSETPGEETWSLNRTSRLMPTAHMTCSPFAFRREDAKRRIAGRLLLPGCR